jgi:hypothetical protein
MLHLLLVGVTDIEKTFDGVYPIEHLLLLSLVYLIVVAGTTHIISFHMLRLDVDNFRLVFFYITEIFEIRKTPTYHHYNNFYYHI